MCLDLSYSILLQLIRQKESQQFHTLHLSSYGFYKQGVYDFSPAFFIQMTHTFAIQRTAWRLLMIF